MVNSELRFSFGLATVAMVTLAGNPIAAGTVSNSMTVGVTVEDTCHIDAQPLQFGTVSETHESRQAHAMVTLSCTPAASYLVTMDDGTHGAGQTRRMVDASGAHFLRYDIFIDPDLTRRWGQTALNAVGATAPANGRVQLPVYALLDTGPTLPGDYSDTVTVTVQF